MTTESPTCAVCRKHPKDIEEYVEAASAWNDEFDDDDELSPDEYCRAEEGTYNEDNNLFVCTACYIRIGMPTSPSGWKPRGLMRVTPAWTEE
jgi:hypothetical protein